MVVGMVRWGFETRDNEHSGELATCFHFVTVIVIDIPTRRYLNQHYSSAMLISRPDTLDIKRCAVQIIETKRPSFLRHL